jgi:hypothetical protein
MSDLNESGRIILEECNSEMNVSGRMPLSHSSSARDLNTPMDFRKQSSATTSSSPRDFATLTIPLLQPGMIIAGPFMKEISINVLLAKLNDSPYYNLALASLTKINPARVDVQTVCEFLRRLCAASLYVGTAKVSRKKFTSQFHEEAFKAVASMGHFRPHEFEKSIVELDSAVVLFDQMVCMGNSDFNTPRPTD